MVVMVYGHTSFANRNTFHDFLFSPLIADRTLPKRDLLLKERICSYRSIFSPLRGDPIEKGRKNENGSFKIPQTKRRYQSV